jgi:hypothetical protein
LQIYVDIFVYKYLFDMELLLILAPPNDSGGLAPPPPVDSSATTPDPGTEEATPEDKPEEQTLDGDSNKPKKVWMDFEQFCKCFK